MNGDVLEIVTEGGRHSLSSSDAVAMLQAHGWAGVPDSLQVFGPLRWEMPGLMAVGFMDGWTLHLDESGALVTCVKEKPSYGAEVSVDRLSAWILGGLVGLIVTSAYCVYRRMHPFNRA
jgi:hypothetical protein